MDYSDLKLQVGEQLQMQARGSEDSRRLNVRVIGYLPGHSLLVTAPRVKGNVMIIREGQPFVVRMMVGNRIVGFATTVMRTCSRPYAYLHLSYPEEMEQIVVRQAQRISVKLFASFKNANPAFKSDKGHSAVITDISTSGALVQSERQLGEIGDKIVLTCAFRIADAEKLLVIPSVLRNVHAEHVDGTDGEGPFYHGLEFKLKDQQDTFALHGFVYEQIVKGQSE